MALLSQASFELRLSQAIRPFGAASQSYQLPPVVDFFNPVNPVHPVHFPF